MNDTLRSTVLAQAGVLSRAQALGSGLSPRQIDRLLSTREWLAVHPGVYRVHASVPLPDTGLWASSLWLGPGFLLADEGAAWWWDVLPEPPNGWTFVGPTHRRGAHGTRVVNAFVAAEDQWRHRGIPVLGRTWAVLRAAAVRERRRSGQGIELIDRAKQIRAVRQGDLERALARHPGCWGSSTMRTMLRRTGDRAHSELERTAVSLLREAGIDGFEPNLTVRLRDGVSVEIDIAFPDQRIAIELDGYAYHSSADAFRRDVRRVNGLLKDGWTVRRFTWDDVVGDPEGFLDAVRELLRS